MIISTAFIRNTSTDGDSISIKESLSLKTSVYATQVTDRPLGVNLYTDINDFLNDRTVQINELVSSIKRHGVLPAADGIRKSVLDDISVNLGRNGEILFNNRGHHRLSIAKILGINTVPVQVVVVHASLSNGS